MSLVNEHKTKIAPAACVRTFMLPSDSPPVQQAVAERKAYGDRCKAEQKEGVGHWQGVPAKWVWRGL
eukprot:8169454-Alexandrium_andersonii.AAC.1